MKQVLLGFLLCLASATTWGLEIPVRRGGSGGSSVGYVDMELVFREYPEAKKARDEYRQEVVRKKGDLAERERVLEDLKREIDGLKAKTTLAPAMDRSSATVGSLMPNISTMSLGAPALSTGTPSDLAEVPAQKEAVSPTTEAPVVSTVTAAVLAEGLSKREEELLKRQKELEEARASAAQDLRVFEAARAKTILGRLYKALVELANERGISLVVDKSAILYGQNTIDLTEALNRRVRGLPEEVK